jgi:hypothetical protein
VTLPARGRRPDSQGSVALVLGLIFTVGVMLGLALAVWL